MRMRAVHHPPQGKINVTPLIDVVMCLIIFYLIVGKLATDRAAKVELPPSSTGIGETSSPGLIVNIVPSTDGPPKLVVEGVEISEAALDAMLRAKGASTEVTIRSDKSLAYEHAGRVVALCRDAGLPGVKLAARREGSN